MLVQFKFSRDLSYLGIQNEDPEKYVEKDEVIKDKMVQKKAQLIFILMG